LAEGEPAKSVYWGRKRIDTVVVDATGLRVYGAGEWHVRKHRRGRRRAWRKPHLSVDEATKEIVAADITQSNVHDRSELDAEGYGDRHI
jgi:hypothetical protein